MRRRSFIRVVECPRAVRSSCVRADREVDGAHPYGRPDNVNVETTTLAFPFANYVNANTDTVELELFFDAMHH